MTVYRLPRSGLPAIRFTGALLAQSPCPISADLAKVGRWAQVSAYSLYHSALLLAYVHYASDKGEPDNYLAALTSDPCRYLSTLDPGEWAIRAPPADRNLLRQQFARALADLDSQLSKPERLVYGDDLPYASWISARWSIHA